jgi:hypothetical protein
MARRSIREVAGGYPRANVVATSPVLGIARLRPGVETAGP